MVFSKRLKQFEFKRERRHYYVGLHCENFSGAVQLLLLGSFSVDDGDANENVTFKEFMVFQILTRLFQFTFKNVKCRRISLELTSWGAQPSLKEKEKFVVAYLRPPSYVKLRIFTP